MKVYGVEHDGIWLGGYSVVVAESAEEAELMVIKMMKDKGIKYKDDITFTEIDISTKGVTLLWNGDY